MKVEYDEDMDVAYFDGLKFRRDKKTGYYLNSRKHIRLHRYVWEYYNGKIPDGYCIHHIDEDKSHNDIENLACISKSDHATLHSKERAEFDYDELIRNLNENARPKASEWHRSNEGREWHKTQWSKSLGKVQPKEYICQNCGKTFYSKRYASKYCCNACASSARRKSGADNVIKICPICGKEFSSNKYAGVQCCSKSCANKLKWNRRRQVVMG